MKSVCSRQPTPYDIYGMRLLAISALAVCLVDCSDRTAVGPGLPTLGLATAPLPAAARYIVELRAAGAVPASLASVIHEAGGTVLRSHAGTGLALVAGLSQPAATALRTRPEVEAVIPDIVRRYIPAHSLSVLAAPRSAGAPGTPARLRSYPAGDPHNAAFYAAGDQWNMSAVQADTAWEVSLRGSGAEVYILDSGIDTAHIEFKGGRIDLARSITFAYAHTDTLMLNPLPFYNDVIGHGTFVSGIVSTNGDSLASVAPSARIVMVRVVDDSGGADLFGIVNGILYAADNGANVINMSFGGYLARNQSIDLTIADLIQRVIDYAYQSGTLLVAAAGNEALNTNDAIAPTGSYADSMDYPAGMPHVLSVGATAPVNQVNDYRIASYSNYGEAGVGVFAPGGDSVAGSVQIDFLLGPCSAASNAACTTENMYYLGSGTSFASPHAAATAAVAKSQSGFSLLGASLEACELGSAIEVTGVRHDVNYGYGFIDVLRAATKCRNAWTFVP